MSERDLIALMAAIIFAGQQARPQWNINADDAVKSAVEILRKVREWPFRKEGDPGM